MKLYDSRWVNIVNHDDCYRDWSKEDAIAHAVRMTEAALADQDSADARRWQLLKREIERDPSNAMDAIMSHGFPGLMGYIDGLGEREDEE
jgi:hypothetical protein